MQFSKLLKEFRMKKGLTQAELADESGIAHSYVNLIESGKRNPPRLDKIISIANSLELTEEEKNALILSSGQTNKDIAEISKNYDYPSIKILSSLLRDPGVPNKELIENAIISFVGWIQSSLRQGTLQLSILEPSYVPIKENADINPYNEDHSILLRFLHQKILKSLIDQDTYGPTHFLEMAVKYGDWEIKKEIAEALPEIIDSDLDMAIKIVEIFRDDYNDYWRSDIRRRTVEVLPILYPKAPEFVESMLRIRKKDQIYTVIAITESIQEIEAKYGNVTKQELLKSLKKDKAKIEEYLIDINPDSARKIINFLSDLMGTIYTKPEEALKKMQRAAADKDRYTRICVARNIERLLEQYPKDGLEIMESFLRPGEHENVRRPIARSLPAIINTIEQCEEDQCYDNARRIIIKLARDPDLAIRRSFSKILPKLIRVAPQTALKVIEHLKDDEDGYIRNEAKMAILDLIGSERIPKEQVQAEISQFSKMLFSITDENRQKNEELDNVTEKNTTMPELPDEEIQHATQSKEAALKMLLTQFAEKKRSFASLVYEILLNGYMDSAGIPDAFIYALAQIFQSYKEGEMIEDSTEEEKEEQALLGKKLAALLNIKSTEEIFTRFSELFKCAKWEIRSEENSLVAENSECRFHDVFKGLGSVSPCDICCLNLMAGILKNIEPKSKFNAVETLWNGTKCVVEILFNTSIQETPAFTLTT